MKTSLKVEIWQLSDVYLIVWPRAMGKAEEGWRGQCLELAHNELMSISKLLNKFTQI